MKHHGDCAIGGREFFRLEGKDLYVSANPTASIMVYLAKTGLKDHIFGPEGTGCVPNHYDIKT